MKIFRFFLSLLLLGILFSQKGWGQVSYLGLDGGFEGSASIDNTNVYVAAQAGMWTKANATQTIANEITTIRSGINSLKINNTGATGRRVWSPLITVSSTTSAVTIQYYRWVANATNSQQNQEGVVRSGVESLQGTYDTPVAGTWDKETYSPVSNTYTEIAGIIMHRIAGTGGDMFIDDMCIYTGGVDVTNPDPPTASNVGTPTTSSLTVSWTAPGTGVDGGGYLVVRGTADPTTAPNVNGIYAAGNTIGSGTVAYQGTSVSFVDIGLASGTTYYYRIYTYDKAYNYSTALTVSGTTSTGNSTSSDIITANNETPNIDYASKTAAAINSTADGIRVWSFTIRDGGGAADGDALGTILTSVIIDKGGSNGVTSWANTVKQAALYDGVTEVAEISVTGETMSFSSISVTAADDGSKTLDLYLSFETTNITDNEQFQFRIQKANTTTDGAGSSFAAFADVTSSVTGDNNRIEVTATKLNFVQQPSNTAINAAMSPSVTVEAADANNQRDRDFTSSIRITSTGTLTGSPVDVAAVLGLSTFSTLTHTVIGTGFTLNAERTATLDWDITSSAFDILNIYTTLLDNYDGVGNLTYTTEGAWNFSGIPNDEYECETDGLTDPEHSYASYNLSNSFPDWNLNNANENSWCGWMDLNRTIVSGWGASNYSCAMVLAANSNDFNAATTSGIAIGFRDDDVLVLFRFSAGIVSGTTALPGTSTLIVATTYTYSDVDNGVNFFVEYLAGGTWKVYWLSGDNLSDANAVNKASYTGGNVTSGVDNTYTGSAYSYAGWAYAHSSAADDIAFFDNFSAGQEPGATTITTSAVSGSPFCVTASAGASVTVNFTSTGTFTGTNDYTAQLSDAAGSFSSPVNIGSLDNTSANSGTISSTIPAGTVSGTGYRIRVIANDPATTGTNNGTDLIIVLGPENVTGVSATAGNTQATLSWTNSATCYDQILVVGKATTSVTALPTGDGTLYTANSVFSTGGSGANLPANEYAVYKNTGASVTVTGLTNGTQYCFKIFTRKGTTWSSGVEQCVTPAVITTLIGGDLAILGIDANHAGSCGGGAADDEISFVCFKDIVTGTALDFTDNGWQRTTANKWGNTEGTIRMTRTGGTILAGVVMTLKVDESITDAAAGRYSIIMPVGGGWTFSEMNFNADFNMNSGGDQVYFMQGGTWNGGTYGDHDATYTGGEVLFGFSTTGSWIDYGASTQKSGLYPFTGCFAMAPTSSTDFDKYTGPLTAATQREWISRINNPLNWTSYARCIDYTNGGTNFAGGYTITINAGGFTPGKWLGSASTDWFNCSNWESLQVPDSLTNVSLPAAGVTFDPLIATEGALSNNLTSESPRVLTINGTGTLKISGDLINNSTITHTAGTVTFDGLSAQSIDGSSTTTFYNLTVNNSSSTGLTLNSPVNISSSLTLTDGFLFTDATNILTVQDNATSSSGSAASFVDGPIKKTGNDAFVFPTGDGTRWARIGITAPTTATTEYTAQYFATAYSNPNLGPGLNNISTKEYWTLDQAVNNDDVQVTLFWENDIYSGINDCDGTPDDLRVVHFDAVDSRWEIDVDGVNITGGCAGGPTAGTVQTNAVQPYYSPFTFGSKGAAQNPLPVKWLSFTAQQKGAEVMLNWVTATEINNDYFNIEKSINGTDFESIEKIKGAGNSSQKLNYFASDPRPYSGTSYYRLKQTDFDGKHEYSNIVAVTFNDDNASNINIYPNLNDGYFVINGVGENAYFILFNSFGEKIISEEISSPNTEIRLMYLSDGIYFILIISDTGSTAKKIIVNK